MKKFIEYISNELSEWRIAYRVHATRRMFERGIEEKDIIEVLQEGTIIEEYLKDYPLPSFLLNRASTEDRPLHLVVAVDNLSKQLYIITAYEPDPLKWIDHFTRRV